MLIRHSAVYVAAKVVPGVLGMATTAVLTHILDPASYGLYGFALVLMSFGATMGFDWLNISFLRFYQARREDPKVFSTVVQLFALIVLSSAIAFGLVWWSGVLPTSDRAIYVVGLLLIWAYAWFELVTQFEIADFRPLRYFAMNLQRAICMMVGTVGAAILTNNPVWTATGTAIGILAGSIPVRGKNLRVGRRTFDTALACEIFAFGIPLAASLVMSSIVTSGTRALIQWLGSSEGLGFYTAAFVLVQNTLVVLASGIAAAGYSLAVRAVEGGDPAATRQQLLDNATLLLMVMAPASLGMALTAHGIASTLVGSRYVVAVSALTPWLAAGSFFGTFRAHFLDHAFQLGRRPYLQIRVIGVAAVVSISLSLWLIPRTGSQGAAVAVAIAMAASCIHAYFEGLSAYPMPLPIRASCKIAAGCFAMAGAVYALSGDTTMRFAMQVIAGCFVYVIAMICFNVLGIRDVLMRTLILRRRQKFVDLG